MQRAVVVVCLFVLLASVAHCMIKVPLHHRHVNESVVRLKYAFLPHLWFFISSVLICDFISLRSSDDVALISRTVPDVWRWTRDAAIVRADQVTLARLAAMGITHSVVIPGLPPYSSLRSLFHALHTVMSLMCHCKMRQSHSVSLLSLSHSLYSHLYS